MSQLAESAGMWPGKAYIEASRAYQRAREAGMSPFRALVVGAIASFKDCWSFRAKIAKRLGISVRTVQRAINEALELGLITQDRVQKERAKVEIPPGAKPATPRPCGWCHRFTTGWGQGVERARKLIHAAVAARAVALTAAAVKAARTATVATKSAVERVVERPKTPFQRRMTAAEIDAELAREDAERAERLKRGEPPPD